MTGSPVITHSAVLVNTCRCRPGSIARIAWFWSAARLNAMAPSSRPVPRSKLNGASVLDIQIRFGASREPPITIRP